MRCYSIRTRDPDSLTLLGIMESLSNYIFVRRGFRLGNGSVADVTVEKIMGKEVSCVCVCARVCVCVSVCVFVRVCACS